MKASHGAGPRSAGRRSQGNGDRLFRLAHHGVQGLGAAVIDVQLDLGDPQNAGQGLGDALQDAIG